MQADLGSQMVNMLSALLLLTCFTIVAQRRLSACVDLYALQSFLLASTAALVAFLSGMHHLYIAAALNLVIKVVAIPLILKRMIKRLNVKQEIQFVITIPLALLISGGLVILAYDIIEPVISMGFLLTKDSLAISLAIILIGFSMMIFRRQEVSQVIGFLVIENGLFLLATAAAYGMPLLVELGIFFDLLVAGLILGVFLELKPQEVDEPHHTMNQRP
jgi:hydrogenase-4 component E